VKKSIKTIPVVDPKEKDCCKNCRFYQNNEECHKDSPYVVVIFDEPITMWPSTENDMWCGQHERNIH
jgi:hypothetical protein